MAGLYGRKFAVFVLYINHVEIPTPSFSALCETGVLEGLKMGENSEVGSC